ncbi:hypothetical protein [Micromonospora sp. AMSO12t]|uniref:hypothetical protein n=1 Tax=unclassified Micromonospora TaxID=2617518 RepID=UPI001CECFD34|nr:hypothetical protein [Micromonospora sp. AMSO12t]
MSSREPTSLRQRWTAYQDLPTLTEHWYWRPGWHTGRHFYTWHPPSNSSPHSTTTSPTFNSNSPRCRGWT